MKTGRYILIFLIVILSAGCSKQNTGGYDKKQALENFNVCSKLADAWLKKLDSTDYSNLKSVLQLRGRVNIEISSYINEVKTVYGKITDRKFLGSHIYFHSSRSLLTYAPGLGEKELAYIHADRSEDGFYIVQPKYFGLTTYKRMFSGYPDGDYVVLMYKVSSMNKSYAEERLTFVRARWNNPDGSWRVVDYKIAEDV